MEQEGNKIVFQKIKNGDEQAFEAVFHKFYRPLCSYAFRFLNDVDEAEEIVQDIFVKLWEKKANIVIESSLKNYLFRSIRNQCLNQIQHNKIKNTYADKVKENTKPELQFSGHFMEPGLYTQIEKAISSMPEKRREIFRLSREEGLKYKEIADKQGISVKTVEAQMGHALKYLRKKLKRFNQ